MGKVTERIELLEKCSLENRSRWLSAMIYSITMIARETYLQGTLDVRDPCRLRVFNEFTHRVATYQLSLYGAPEEIMPICSFGEIVSEYLSRLSIDEETLFSITEQCMI